MVDNLIDPSHSGHAVLSQNFVDHLENLVSADLALLNQAHHHPHMLHQGPRQRALSRGWRRAFLPLLQRWGFAAALVVVLFPLSSLLRPVPGNTASDRLPPTMLLAATKRTTKLFAPHTPHLFAPGVTGIGEKEDPAMPAAFQASSQVGLGSQNRSKQQIILQQQTGNPLASIPVRPKLKSLLDLYCKKT